MHETGDVKVARSPLHRYLIFCKKVSCSFMLLFSCVSCSCWCRLVEEYPDRGVAWFGVGCYYLCTRQFETARRYFGKATSMDNAFAAAWIGFGHSFAFQDESDQVQSYESPISWKGRARCTKQAERGVCKIRMCLV